jgi:hypothetical protein
VPTTNPQKITNPTDIIVQPTDPAIINATGAGYQYCSKNSSYNFTSINSKNLTQFTLNIQVKPGATSAIPTQVRYIAIK